MVMCNCRKQIQEINWQRKNEQTDAGANLKQLEERYKLFAHWTTRCFVSLPGFCTVFPSTLYGLGTSSGNSFGLGYQLVPDLHCTK